MEELEKKNKDNNSKISVLISRINILQKEQQKINKEMNELKDEFKKIKSNNCNEINNRNILQNLEKKAKTKSTIKYNNSLNILLNNEFSEDIIKENNNFILNENISNKNLNNTYFNNFGRVQRKIIIKRDDKNDNKRGDINENDNNKKLKGKKIDNFKKSPLNGNDKFPKDNNFTIE